MCTSMLANKALHVMHLPYRLGLLMSRGARWKGTELPSVAAATDPACRVPREPSEQVWQVGRRPLAVLLLCVLGTLGCADVRRADLVGDYRVDEASSAQLP